MLCDTQNRGYFSSGVGLLSPTYCIVPSCLLTGGSGCELGHPWLSRIADFSQMPFLLTGSFFIKTVINSVVTLATMLTCLSSRAEMNMKFKVRIV